MNPGLVLAFDDEWMQAEALAGQLRVPLARVRRHRFPDGEIRLTLPPRLPARVVLLRSLHPPNERLVELMLALPTARELGAGQIVLVCPYLAYMRQDLAFHPGEAVSQRHVAGWLAGHVDALVTVDPHLHRIDRLDQIMPGCRSLSVSAAELLGDWVMRHVERPLLLGPDAESAQWVRAAAGHHALDHAVCTKHRLGDAEVRVRPPDGVDLRGRRVVLMDDVASTGHTLAGACRVALAAGAISVDVAVTHALFVGDAGQVLKRAGVRHVWSTDTVPHASSVVSIAPLLSRTVKTL